MVEATFADLRYALRRLRQSPTFALVAVLTLALGIGASTAIFSAVAPILLEPLPYPNAERVVTLTDRTSDGAPLDTTYGTYVEVAARNNTLDALAVAQRWNPALSGSGEAERLTGDRVTADYFRVLGVPPAIGRNFTREDQTIGGPQRVIVSDALAKRRFGSARNVLDQAIDLTAFSTRCRCDARGLRERADPGADVWSAMQFREQAPFQSGEWGHQLRMIGRLRAGVPVENAQQRSTPSRAHRSPSSRGPNGLRSPTACSSNRCKAPSRPVRVPFCSRLQARCCCCSCLPART